MYRYLLVDCDNTLLDFDLAEARALRETLTQAGILPDEETIRLYHHINAALWKALERGETTAERLALQRFEQLLEALDRHDLTAEQLRDLYHACLGRHGELLEGALELMQRVHPWMKVALVTNGFSDIQRGRMQDNPIAPMLDVLVISGEYGVSKPDPRLVDIALEKLGCTDRREAIFLGDSATSDIAAAVAAGIDSVHFKPNGNFTKDATFKVRTLAEAGDVMLATQEKTISAAQAYIAKLFAGDSSGHDEQHSLRVWRNAAAIAAKEGGDRFVIELAALLHDADDRKLFGTEETLANARGFMRQAGVPGDEAERVCAVIRGVSFKGGHNAPPQTQEGMIVQDADRLDAIGAIGIGRAFAYGGAKGRAMHLPEEAPKLNMTAAEYAANQGTTINHFYEKLLLLRDRMNTTAARELADARHAFMQRFLDEFLGEWNGER